MNQINIQYYKTKIGELVGYGGGLPVKKRLLKLEKRNRK